MSGNIHSFSSNPISDSLLLYSIVLSVFIFFWVLIGLALNIGFNSNNTTIVFMRSSFESFEFNLLIFSSILVILLSLLNVLTIRSQVPYYLFSFLGSKEDGSFNRLLNINVVGRQWYWSYYLADNESEENDSVESYITSLINVVDNSLNLSINNLYTLNITSADVIHAFSLPSINVKVDAMPGRISQVNLFANVCGQYIGYCSEFCGAGHAYMPIVVNVLD